MTIEYEWALLETFEGEGEELCASGTAPTVYEAEKCVKEYLAQYIWENDAMSLRYAVYKVTKKLLISTVIKS